MSVIPSTETLLQTVQRYYDSSNAFLFTPEPTFEETQRQALWSKWIEAMGPWKSFKAALRSQLPSHVVGETYSSADGGPRCVVYPPETQRTAISNWLVVGCVSLLAPVYFVYGAECDYDKESGFRNMRVSFGSPPPDMREPARLVAQAIESSFGFSPISREVAKTPVPLFAGLLEPPETTLFHTLFSSAPQSIP